jgi:hypothetical protein
MVKAHSCRRYYSFVAYSENSVYYATLYYATITKSQEKKAPWGKRKIHLYITK